MSFSTNLFFSFLIAILWFYTEPILNFFGFDHSLTRMGSSYAVWAIPALLFDAFNTTVSAYLFSIHVTSLPLRMQLCASVVDVLVSYVLIFGLPFMDLLGMEDSLKAVRSSSSSVRILYFTSSSFSHIMLQC